MDLKVTARFYDKKEAEYVEKDTVIEREDERAQELIKAGVVVPFEEKKPEKKKAKKKADNEAPVDLAPAE